MDAAAVIGRTWLLVFSWWTRMRGLSATELLEHLTQQEINAVIS